MTLSNRLLLTEAEQEIFCDILANDELQADESLTKERKKLLKTLAERYETGNEHTLRNSEKAREYRKQLGLPEEDLDGDAHTGGDKLLTAHRFYNRTRQLLGNVNTILSYVNKGKGFLPRLFSLAGLSYGLELLIDLIIIALEVTQPVLSDYEKDLSPLERVGHRLKLAFSDSERLSRMSNDAVWFTINLIGFVLLGPIALIVNPIISTAGSAFDIIHDGFFCWLNSSAIVKVSDKINDQIVSNNAEINKLETILDKAIIEKYPALKPTLNQAKQDQDTATINAVRDLAPAKESRLISDTRKRLSILKSETASLKKLAPHAEEKINDSEKAAVRTLAGAGLILVGGVLMFLFPPLGVGVSIIGIIGAIALFTGACVLQGFGPSLFDAACGAFKKIGDALAPSPSVKNPELELATVNKPSMTVNDSYVKMRKKLQIAFQKPSHQETDPVLVDEKEGTPVVAEKQQDARLKVVNDKHYPKISKEIAVPDIEVQPLQVGTTATKSDYFSLR